VVLALILAGLIANSFIASRRLNQQSSALQKYLMQDMTQLIKVHRCVAELMLLSAIYEREGSLPPGTNRRSPKVVARELAAHANATYQIGKLAAPEVVALLQQGDPLGYAGRVGPLVEQYLHATKAVERAAKDIAKAETTEEELSRLSGFPEAYAQIRPGLTGTVDQLGQLQSVYMAELSNLSLVAYRNERILGMAAVFLFLLLSMAFLLYYRDNKRATALLRTAVKQKDTINREIHHRVKNNLALVSSLINLKKSGGDATAIFRDLERQIHAITVVHEQLYLGETASAVEMRSYVESLLKTAFSSFGTRSVRLEISVENLRVDSKIAVPVGLVINEIATNATKHGFRTDEDAVFSVKFRCESPVEQCVLEIWNSGAPFPEDVDIEAPDTLGLRLIVALVAQIQGTLDLERTPSPKYTIRFPAPVA
jgi:two-component sensor histidine kinase